VPVWGGDVVLGGKPADVADLAQERGDLAEQRGGPVGGEVASGAGRGQVDQQPVKPVEGLGARADQVRAAVGQQAQHHRLVLDADLA
jgi:hypothetical protein